jgi:hypothetical protein
MVIRILDDNFFSMADLLAKVLANWLHMCNMQRSDSLAVGVLCGLKAVNIAGIACRAWTMRGMLSVSATEFQTFCFPYTPGSEGRYFVCGGYHAIYFSWQLISHRHAWYAKDAKNAMVCM